MAARSAAQRVATVVGGGLVDSIWVRRLERISFLGTLDHHPRSKSCSDRRIHSLAVAELGMRAAQDLDLDPGSTREFVAACLLHDIGHFPLSHAAEPAFRERLGVGHHEVTQWIVLGQGPIAKHRSLRAPLEDLGIEPEGVWQIISGDTRDVHRQRLAGLLQGTINLDTLDGIVRVARNFRMRRPTLPRKIFSWQGGVVIRAEAIAGMDAFWRLKDRVYDRVINLPSNILAEARLCELVHERCRDAAIFERFEEFDDEALGRKLGVDGSKVDPGDLVLDEDGDYELRNAAGWGEVLRRTRKRYYVQGACDAAEFTDHLPFAQWRRRYRHRREAALLVSRRRQLELPGVAGPKLAIEGPQI